MLDPSLWPDVKYCKYQEEVGASGTPHLQGFVLFERKKTLVSVSRLEGLEHAHLEVMRGTIAQNDDYTGKAAGRLGGPYSFGESPGHGQGARTDLDNIAASLRSGVSLKRVAEDYPSNFIRYHRGLAALQNQVAPRRGDYDFTLCFVFYGAGGTGKSTFARRLAHFLSSDDGCSGDVYHLSPPKSSGTYWDGYNQGDVVIIDEFKGNRFQPTAFNQLIDAGALAVPTHGGQIQFNSRYVLVTTNVSPKNWWPNLEFRRSLRRRLILFPIFRNLARTRASNLPSIIFEPRLGQFIHQ